MIDVTNEKKYIDFVDSVICASKAYALEDIDKIGYTIKKITYIPKYGACGEVLSGRKKLLEKRRFPHEFMESTVDMPPELDSSILWKAPKIVPDDVSENKEIEMWHPDKYIEECNFCRGKGKIDCSCQNGIDICWACKGEGIQTCEKCHGKGNISTYCFKCKGKGYYFDYYDEEVRCPNCYGSGWEEESCKQCNATGKVTCTSCGGNKYAVCQKCKGSLTFACKECDEKGYFFNGIWMQYTFFYESYNTDLISPLDKPFCEVIKEEVTDRLGDTITLDEEITGGEKIELHVKKNKAIFPGEYVFRRWDAVYPIKYMTTIYRIPYFKVTIEVEGQPLCFDLNPIFAHQLEIKRDLENNNSLKKIKDSLFSKLRDASPSLSFEERCKLCNDVLPTYQYIVKNCMDGKEFKSLRDNVIESLFISLEQSSKEAESSVFKDCCKMFLSIEENEKRTKKDIESLHKNREKKMKKHAVKSSAVTQMCLLCLGICYMYLTEKPWSVFVPLFAVVPSIVFSVKYAKNFLSENDILSYKRVRNASIRITFLVNILIMCTLFLLAYWLL